MAEVTLTAEQAAAVGAEDSAVVRAGAGSGKTTVLASRVLRLIGPGDDGTAPRYPVDAVLAITFTEKAAAETRRRIHELVGVRIAATAGGLRRHWERLRAELVGARLSTIHGLCARLLREHPLEAGIDPRATILDEHGARAWNERAVERELTARVRAGDPAAAALLSHRRGLAGGRAGDGAVATVVRLLGRLLVSGRDGAWLAEAHTRQQETAPTAERALRTAIADVRAIVARVLDGKARGIARTHLRENWPEWDGLLERVGRLEPGLDLGPLRALRVDLGRLHAGAAPALDGKEALRGTIADEYHFLTTLPLTTALVGLLGELAGAVRTEKQRDAVLTFDDLVFEADRLLASHPAVATSAASGLAAILVDEFQDTDAVQASVVSRLAAANPPCRIFVVGDEKQSIYRFRGADVRVFNTMRATLGTEVNLGTNFRSRPGILAFVNALAARTMRIPAGGDSTRWTVFDAAHRLIAARPPEGREPAVRFVSLLAARAGRRPDVAAVRELEANVLAGVVADLHDRAERPRRWGDIAILLRSLVPVKAYEHALRQRSIPYYVVKGRGFFQCQEIRDLVSLLTVVVDPADEVALAAALRSPLLGISDDTLVRLAWGPDADRPQLGRRFRSGDGVAGLVESRVEVAAFRELVDRLRRVASRATVAEVIEAALAATDFEAVLLTQFQGAQRVANVRKLIELARRLEVRRPIGLAAFVRVVDDLMQREPREAEAALATEQDDVVRLMTIHQAKGLEFGAVILADLGREPEADRQQLVLDDDLGLVVGPVGGAGGHPLGQARLAEYRMRERDRDRAERARLLYVAVTRARDELVLLEGCADEGYLEGTGKGADRWCHQVWDVLGHEAIRAVAGGATEVRVTLDDHPVAVEAAGRYLADAQPITLAAPREIEPSQPAREAVSRVLDYASPSPIEVIVSPTALATFRQCPRRYWYAHVLGLDVTGMGGTRARVAGTVVHAVLETLDPRTAGPDDVDAALARRPELHALAAATRAALRSDLVAALALLAAEAARGIEILGREVPFVLPLPSAQPRVLLEGRIDVVARRGDEIVVRDYKYAPASAAGAATYAAQLGSYALAVPRGQTPVATEVVFLRGGPVVWPLTKVDPAGEEAAILSAADALAAARAAGTIEAHPRRPPDPAVCRELGCGYVRVCWRPAVSDRATRPATCTAGA